MGMKNDDIIQSEGKFFWSIAKNCRSIVWAIPAINKLPPMLNAQLVNPSDVGGMVAKQCVFDRKQ